MLAHFSGWTVPVMGVKRHAGNRKVYINGNADTRIFYNHFQSNAGINSKGTLQESTNSVAAGLGHYGPMKMRGHLYSITFSILSVTLSHRNGDDADADRSSRGYKPCMKNSGLIISGRYEWRLGQMAG